MVTLHDTFLVVPESASTRILRYNEGMRAQRILAHHKAELDELCRKYGVLRLRLFGSALRDDWDPNQSDFDFLPSSAIRSG